MDRTLLGSAYYGDEINDLPKGTHRTRMTLHYALPAFRNLQAAQWDAVERVVHSHFGTRREGVFGGQITAGDGWFIGAFMAAMKPQSMIEIGVASGYSSALILSFAREFGLLTEGETFLHSFDIEDIHLGGHQTGALMRRDFAELLPFWSLSTKQTTLTIDGAALSAKLRRPALAFLDGGHNHPWPVVDIAFLRRHIPQCDWALMQDVQMMERWVSDAIVYDAPVPSPVRGVQLAVSHWPGAKIIGTDICYNMAAVHPHIDDRNFALFCDSIRHYPSETVSDQQEACERFMAKLGYGIKITSQRAPL